MKTETTYFVVPGPGYYGDKTRVSSAHRSLVAARRAAGRKNGGSVVRVGALRSGDQWLRVYEQTYPVAE